MKCIFLLFLLLLTACTNNQHFRTEDDYKNREKYSVIIGDTIEIYYTTNSCCLYCQPNAEQLNHLKYAGKRIMIREPKGCEGCNHTAALLFVAKSEGVDTIYGGIITPTAKCNDSLKALNRFIVEIRP